ncbi:hypothetical protein MPTK1_1g04180 [Marchantia polymorpha subsp. ruderalis]|uniref:Uncharacterized protein n=2 Tax=Marchantia polymorpha TaxID=3197 RepID=A0AAF6ALD0_MARPO|nr:hypothetical protein MARPO_0005s0189 [Marchantia polymorpha]BBM97250.1 hypothetical protein Mp_1g04180 [Marchantia polymorpha subsp. ruderalis]|eukprot:PTQ48558.1 hypothetical protein MARPO_0005s0189 [Marchantia polymorpha]
MIVRTLCTRRMHILGDDSLIFRGFGAVSTRTHLQLLQHLHPLHCPASSHQVNNHITHQDLPLGRSILRDPTLYLTSLE